MNGSGCAARCSICARAWHVQTRGQGNLSLLTSSLAYLAPIVPLIVALPRYLAGDIQLGGLMQTAQAFSSVQWALSWLIDNFPKFADWRASIDRVVHLHMALHDLEERIETPDDARIEVACRAESDRLIMREVGRRGPTARCWWPRPRSRSSAGERVLIRGQSGSGKSTIMRAVAGVWPWGRGSVQLPRGAHRLHAAEALFPARHAARGDALSRRSPTHRRRRVLQEVLHKVGLDHLRGRLDENERWDHILSGGEQQRVAFARVLIQKPALGVHGRGDLGARRGGPGKHHELLAEDLPETAVVSIGHRPGLEAFHTRELVLEPGEEGAQLRARAGERGLRDIYRRMAAASRAEPAGPGFWSNFRRTFVGR